jgi:signal transduction histidine kinase
MRRWRDSVTTMIALTVVVAMVLGVSLQHLVSSGLLFLGLAPQQTVRKENTRLFRQLPSRVAFLIEVISATPDPERPAVILAAQRPEVGVRLLDAPFPNLVNRGDPGADLIRRRIEAALTVPLTAIVADRYRPMYQQAATDSGFRDGELIEAALSDGHWVLFTSSLQPPPAIDPVAAKFSRTNFYTWLSLSMILAVLLSTLAARRLVMPLSELATAVEQLGGSGDILPIPARGPREVQKTIQAFNRMQERLRRFNEDRTRMIAAMSHDLRTPLTRLQLRLEIVEDRENRRKMLGDLTTMSEMIESVLSFARDDTKHEPRSLVDLSALVEGVCDEAADAGAPATYSGPRDVAIWCRPTMVRRAITNIVDNAAKYGGSAAVGLIPGAEHVVITVEDEGPGIPRSEREKVFDPFYRLEGSRNPGTGGVGLGLSVARSIIWEHGGDITLANRRGGGLTVRLELPTGSGVISSDPDEMKSNTG